MKHNKRVLIIEDDPEYAELLAVVLSGSGSPFEVQRVATLADGLAALTRFKADVILLDLDLPDSSGYDTFLRVRSRAEGTPILVLTGLDDDLTALKAAEDGAQDYLVKGLQQPKLIARCVNMALRRQARIVAPRPSPHVLGFIGSKGGVGTSTIAINIAAHLSETGCDTLAIELQPGPGTMAGYLPVKPAYGVNSLQEISPGRLTATDLEGGLMEVGPALRILCPGVLHKPWPPPKADSSQAIVSLARQMCTYLILDLPSRVDEGVAAAVKFCDTIALIVDRETSSVRAAGEILEQLKAAGAEESRLRLIAVDRSGLEVPAPLAEIFTHLKLHPVFVIPHTAPQIAHSQSARLPLVWIDPESAFSQAILDLAGRLLPPTLGHHSKVATQRKMPKPADYVPIPSVYLG